MALETATYINQLVDTNPTATDPIRQADDHLRLIKAALKTTFPQITGAVTATQAELNKLDGVTATTAEINYIDGVTSPIQTQLNTKLASASYTATDVRTKLLTVDGASSGVDADLLDGQHGSYYLTATNLNAGTVPTARLPAATETAIGALERATQAEAEAGTDNTRAMTPLRTKQAILELVPGPLPLVAGTTTRVIRESVAVNSNDSNRTAMGCGLISIGGTIRVQLSHRVSSGPQTSTVDVQKNGVTVQSWSTTSTTYQNRSVDVDVDPGDRIDVRHRVSNEVAGRDSWCSSARITLASGTLALCAEEDVERVFL